LVDDSTDITKWSSYVRTDPKYGVAQGWTHSSNHTTRRIKYVNDIDLPEGLFKW
jgi:hypothetical protein